MEKKEQIRIRTDKTRMAIKCQSFDGRYSHGWRNLESGFETEEQMEERFRELLEDDQYIEG